MIELLNKRVHIEWRKNQGDWHWFTVLGFDQGFIKLRGAVDLDGNEHSGNEFWANMTDISTIEAR